MAAARLRDGLGDLTVTHPIPSRAETLARTLDCHVAEFDELPRLLDDADIVLTAQGSRRQVLNSDMMLVALHRRRKKPVFIVDTSIPGDIEPAVNRIDEAFLYDLGDLESVALEGQSSRVAEAEDAARIGDREGETFLRGRAERKAGPARTGVRGRVPGCERTRVGGAGGVAFF